MTGIPDLGIRVDIMGRVLDPLLCVFLAQGQLLEGVECHIYLYCFTFDDINLNRVLSILSYFQKNIAIRKCVQIK